MEKQNNIRPILYCSLFRGFPKQLSVYYKKHLLEKYKLAKIKRQQPNLICLNKDIVLNNNVVDKGHGNTIIVEEGSTIRNCNIQFYGCNCKLHFGRKVYIQNNDFWFEDSGSEIFIGDGTTTESGCQFAACEGKKIIIGKDCMLSHDIDIRNTDSHTILNENGDRINPSADIIIGDHVWIGIRSTILKGSFVSSECVVAAQSMVTSSIKVEQHTLIAGIPAKVVKTNISWDRRRL